MLQQLHISPALSNKFSISTVRISLYYSFKSVSSFVVDLVHYRVAGSFCHRQRARASQAEQSQQCDGVSVPVLGLFDGCWRIRDT